VKRSSWVDDDTAGPAVRLRNSLMALDQRAAGWLSCHPTRARFFKTRQNRTPVADSGALAIWRAPLTARRTTP